MGADGTLFPLGQVVATPGALIALVRTNQEILELLARHQHGDWGGGELRGLGRQRRRRPRR